MERAHRIGQTKPVRVFRLVCRGSVEERMVSRADKKLFLNAMVAEADPDTDIIEDENGNETSQQFENEVMHALGVEGPTISRRELSSLIRFGANAIISGSNDKYEINDDDLDNILERKGRDVELPSNQVNTESTPDNVWFQNQMVSTKLEEVDLRQLGKFVYNKKKAKKDNEVTLAFDFLEKRKRIERIKMVDGKGTGYGATVPVLASNLEETNDEARQNHVLIRKRGREWTHQLFCCLCGKRNETDDKLRCAHCPRVFHVKCLKKYDQIWKGSGMFICPHHKCAGCGRSTASSGGLLFRCVNCLTSFCEDCLPQDEIESVGRSKELESIGYLSRQSYYIKCPSCLVHIESRTQIESATSADDTIMSSIELVKSALSEPTVDQQTEENGMTNEELPPVDVILFPTQMMRIFNEEIPETPKLKSSRSKRSSTIGKRRLQRISLSAGSRRKKLVDRTKDERSDDEASIEKHSVNGNIEHIRDYRSTADNAIMNQNLSLIEALGLLLSKGQEAESKFLFSFNDSMDNALIRRKFLVRSQQWQSLSGKVLSGKILFFSMNYFKTKSYHLQVVIVLFKHSAKM